METPKPPAPAVRLMEKQGELFELGTGTDGPAPRAKLVASTVRRPPVQVSYRVALSQITGEVLAALRERGEQWDSESRQDLISTLFIAACKEKRVVFDFTPERPR
jgi:hypothetical protein